MHEERMMPILRWCLMVGLAAVLGSAQAHGDWPPKHGGLMNDGGETSFELVGRGPAIAFYVEDHGTPLHMEGARGTITVTRGAVVWSAAVAYDKGNRLITRLPGKLKRGDQVLVRVTLANGSISAGRYVLP